MFGLVVKGVNAECIVGLGVKVVRVVKVVKAKCIVGLVVKEVKVKCLVGIVYLRGIPCATDMNQQN